MLEAPGGNGTGGTASFYYPSGATKVGVRIDRQALTTATTAQQAFEDTANGLLLDSDPPSPGNDYAPTYSGNSVTNETWRRTSDASLLKTIDYTYVQGKVTSEVTKVYATDGATIVAQKTTSYVYTGAKVFSSSTVRNI